MPRIQLRRDTAANWTTSNPVLASGELGFETDTGKFKFGNGSTAWASLDYATAGSALISEGTGTSSVVVGDATTNSVNGNYSVVGGGYNNDITTAAYATVSGGYNNNITNALSGTISGGRNNDITGSSTDAFIAGGYFNDIANSPAAAIGGGSFNEMYASGYSFIGGGLENRIQLYNTLGFIGGGYRNNILTGADGCIVGGRLNFTFGQSGPAVLGGWYNAALGTFSTAVAGYYNYASGALSVAVGGEDNAAIGAHSVVCGGKNNRAAHDFSAISGGHDARTEHYAEMAHSAGSFSEPGDAQVSRVVLRGENNSTTGTTTELSLNGLGAKLTVPENTSWHYTIKLVGRNQSAVESAAYTFEGLLERNELGAVILNETSAVVYEDNPAWQVATSIKTAPAFNLNSRFFLLGAETSVTTISNIGAWNNSHVSSQAADLKLLPIGGLYTYVGDSSQLGLWFGSPLTGFSVYSNGAVYFALSRAHTASSGSPNAYHWLLVPKDNGGYDFVARSYYVKTFDTASSEEDLVTKFIADINNAGRQDFYSVNATSKFASSTNINSLYTYVYFDTDASQLVIPRLAVDCTVDDVAAPTRWVASTEIVQLKYPPPAVTYY